MRATSATALMLGDTFSEVVITELSRTQIVQYAGASGDYNPLHTDEVFTREVGGYPSVFAHGMLTMGATGKLVVSVAGPWAVVSYGARFKAQVWPGDTLTARATVVAVRENGSHREIDLELSTVNQHGVEVLSGIATLRPESAGAA
jgi:acyl dehydratase